MFQCFKCKIEKPISGFRKLSRSRRGHDTICVDCVNKRRREARLTKSIGDKIRSRERKRYKEKSQEVKENEVRRRYGVTYDYIMNLYNVQGRGCAICGIKKPFRHTKNQYDGLYIDHCHSTGKVRGVLCRLCNLLLGYAKDDIDVLESAISYLKNAPPIEADSL